jgi:hypothetical protein
VSKAALLANPLTEAGFVLLLALNDAGSTLAVARSAAGSTLALALSKTRSPPLLAIARATIWACSVGCTAPLTGPPRASAMIPEATPFSRPRHVAAPLFELSRPMIARKRHLPQRPNPARGERERLSGHK